MDASSPADSSQLPNKLPLKDCVRFALDEARMILPGIQALLGFQLIAVFNDRFEYGLDGGQRVVHLGALVFVALACALVMAPAAYHRQAEQGHVSEALLRLASRLIGAALLPLSLGICLDIYLVAFVVTGHQGWSIALGAACFCMFSGLWFALPWALRRRRKSAARP